jgi:hypothetical protein
MALSTHPSLLGGAIQAGPRVQRQQLGSSTEEKWLFLNLTPTARDLLFLCQSGLFQRAFLINFGRSWHDALLLRQLIEILPIFFENVAANCEVDAPWTNEE